jgi:pyrophosphatase PpaX
MTRVNDTPLAILFDVDGTLIDTYRLYLESYRRALHPYLGYLPSVEEFIARRPASERHLLAGWIGEESAAACRAEMSRHYEELHAALCEGMYDGVREMLSALRAAGVPVGVVTGKGRHAWEVTANAVDLGDFDIVITDDDVTEPKPHPGGLVAAATAMAVDRARTLYIGDSMVDMEAAGLAGMRIGAALWPKTAPEDRAEFLRGLQRWTPDWLFERPADVTRLFVSWC